MKVKFFKCFARRNQAKGAKQLILETFCPVKSQFEEVVYSIHLVFKQLSEVTKSKQRFSCSMLDLRGMGFLGFVGKIWPGILEEETFRAQLNAESLL